MAKLTYEDKKEILRLHNEEYRGYRTIAKKFNVAAITVEKIVKRYELHGESSLKKSYHLVPTSIKFEVINAYKAGISENQLVNQYMVSTLQIKKWLNDYEELGYDGLKNKKKGRPPSMKKNEVKQTDPNNKDEIIKQQEQRILELECEVEALKKLRALVQQRNGQQTKKKQ